MVKTATSAGNLWVWVGRPEGPDPRAHGWLEAEEGHWVRLCDGSSWAWACDPGNDFRMNFPVFCWLCDDIAFDDYLSGRKRLRVLSPGWRERYKPSRHNKGMDVQPVEGSMLPVPMSAVVAFGVARTEKKREEIVCRAKYGSSGAGEERGNPNAGFLKCLRESDHPSMVEDVQKNCLLSGLIEGTVKSASSENFCMMP